MAQVDGDQSLHARFVLPFRFLRCVVLCEAGLSSFESFGFGSVGLDGIGLG